MVVSTWEDSVAKQILFEHPLNEKCRTLLRLSHLFEQLDFHSPQDSEWESRATISTLLDIGSILARADIKSDLLKQLERFRSTFFALSEKTGVDTDRLKLVLKDIKRAKNQLQEVNGQLGNSIRTSDFLKTILQRSSIPGGSYDFDLPQYHYWLQQPLETRLIQIKAWRDSISSVENAVSLALGLIRHSADPVREHANSGFFQQTIESKSKPQMVRVSISDESALYAEISGGKHRFSIRFMDTTDWEHPALTQKDAPFLLTLCAV